MGSCRVSAGMTLESSVWPSVFVCLLGSPIPIQSSQSVALSIRMRFISPDAMPTSSDAAKTNNRAVRYIHACILMQLPEKIWKTKKTEKKGQ